MKEWGKFRKLYGTQRWRKLAKAQLVREPLCWRCEKAGRVTPATVCNHTNGHPADETEEQFWAGPFDSQCAKCHSGDQAREERGGVVIKGCDADGWPI